MEQNESRTKAGLGTDWYTKRKLELWSSLVHGRQTYCFTGMNLSRQYMYCRLGYITLWCVACTECVTIKNLMLNVSNWRLVLILQNRVTVII